MARHAKDQDEDETEEAPTPLTPLVCIQPFTAFGIEYVEGDIVDPEEWPEEARPDSVQNRLLNGFISEETETVKAREGAQEAVEQRRAEREEAEAAEEEEEAAVEGESEEDRAAREERAAKRKQAKARRRRRR